MSDPSFDITVTSDKKEPLQFNVILIQRRKPQIKQVVTVKHSRKSSNGKLTFFPFQFASNDPLEAQPEEYVLLIRPICDTPADDTDWKATVELAGNDVDKFEKLDLQTGYDLFEQSLK